MRTTINNICAGSILIALLCLPPNMARIHYNLWDPKLPNRNPKLTLAEVIKTRAAEHNLNPRLIHRVISVESSGNPSALLFYPRLHKAGRSKLLASSIGLMQVLGLTALESCRVQPAALFNSKVNVTCGIKILADCIKQAGSINRGLVCYNGGPGCLKHRCPEAEQYASRV